MNRIQSIFAPSFAALLAAFASTAHAQWPAPTTSAPAPNTAAPQSPWQRLLGSVLGAIQGAVAPAPSAPAPSFGNGGQNPFATPNAGVLINGTPVPEVLRAQAAQLPPGQYWYDRQSGLWGRAGGGTQGILPANLPIMAPLAADASNGQSGVFINGRQLTGDEVAYLARGVGQVPPGQYWLDAQGNAGRVGGPALVNLRQAAQRGQGRAWSHSVGNTHVGGDGNFGFVGYKDHNGKSQSYFIN